MPIYKGLSTINPLQIVINGKQMSKVYVGDKLVWQKLAAQLGYGRLYNWWCTQPQFKSANLGMLYNYYAVTDTRNITNTGWHVPTFGNISTLTTYLGGDSIAGKKLQEIGWGNGTNEVGFNLKRSGFRYGNEATVGTFSGKDTSSFLWLSTEYDTTKGYHTYTALNDGLYRYGILKSYGLGIRLIKDSTTLTNGQTSTYTGNDGRVYKTICIGTQEYLSENLCETKYRDGSLIPEVTSNSSWATLTSGGRCSYNNLESNAVNTTSIAPVGWHIPTQTDFNTLSSFIGGDTVGGGHLKEVNDIYWNNPNIGADNAYLFNARGAGFRSESGSFVGIKASLYYWVTTGSTIHGYSRAILSASANFTFVGNLKNYGTSIRLIKDDSTWTAGDTLTDIDGNIYPTCKIGDQVFTAANWKCTKFNDGTPIPNVTDATAWSNTTTPAYCNYNNLEINV